MNSALLFFFALSIGVVGGKILDILIKRHIKKQEENLK